MTADQPAYRHIAAVLRQEIADRVWAPGERLPTETEMMERFGSGRATIRAALAELQAGGLIRKRRGSGSYVRQGTGIPHSLGDLRSMTDVMRSLGLTPGVEDVEVRIDPNPPAEARSFLPDGSVYRVSRVRTESGEPFAQMISWLSSDVGAAVDAEKLAHTQSLYAVLSDQVGVHLHSATETIHAEGATSAESRVFGVDFGTPLLVIRRWTKDGRGQPVEYTRSAAIGDRYWYTIDLQG